jgi:hypothetical protein
MSLCSHFVPKFILLEIKYFKEGLFFRKLKKKLHGKHKKTVLKDYETVDALTAIDAHLGTHVRDLCALKKWWAMKSCLDLLGSLGIRI